MLSSKPPNSFMVLNSVTTWLTLNSSCLVPKSIFKVSCRLISNRHLRFNVAKTELLVFSTKTEFSSVSRNSNILFARVKFLESCLTPLFLMLYIKSIAKPRQLSLPSKHVHVHELRERSIKLNIKYRNWSTLKQTKHTEHKGQMENVKTIFETYISDKGLIFLIYNEFFGIKIL